MTKKRTNKAERTAMNLTRIAATTCTVPNSMLAQELYEIAQDAGCAMFDGRDCQTATITHAVFIPHKIADEHFEKWNRYNKVTGGKSMRYTDSATFSNMVKFWYYKAIDYIPNNR